MEIRELINRRPAITAIVASSCLLLLGLVAAGQMRHGAETELPKIPTQAFYTTDDGITLFAEDINKLAPFDHDGKQAVRAWVFTADRGAHQWVQYLEKYSEAAKAELVKIQNSKDSGAIDKMGQLSLGIYVKPPRAGKWVRLADAASSSAITKPVAPPDMGTDVPRLITP